MENPMSMTPAVPVGHTIPGQQTEKASELDANVSYDGVSHVKPSWYRSVFFQVTIVGICAFLAPGIFNAMSLTGAGGAQSPYLVNTANAILYSLLTVFCIFGGLLTNLIGFRFALMLGASGYALYAGGLYANKVHGTQWLILFGAAMNGISGGIFWCTEGAIMIGYPEPRKVGRYLGLWLGWRNAGTLIGASINLGLNVNTKAAGSLSSSTYIVFIVLQCIGPLVGFFLSEPDKVQRPDGTPVLMKNPSPMAIEAKMMWTRVFTRWDVLALCPIMLYSTWFSSYAGTFLSLYFNVRSRALASFVTSFVSIMANVALGMFLDSTRISKKFKARFAFISVFFILNIAMWIWQTVMQVKYISSPPKALDWSAGATWYQGWGVYVMVLIMYNINANLLYWVISTMSDDPKDAVRLAGLLRGVEGAGGAGGFGMNTHKTLSKYVPLAFNFAFCVVSSIVAYPVIHRIGTPKANSPAPPSDITEVKEEVMQA
ncbi:major facilitator superfamily domain-containing protein [Naematelia encephala]|uniref:Major facilitator superfamily domain-containing protein n=1 Tax=Naematelia encephala TaxID=71784 RepID=A0A1Y2AEN9_9TREE|nr:major facilitator superfamily domain-containing protein [Naematelia encephala]